MAKYGAASREQRATLHQDLQLIVDEVIKFYDHSLLQGHRDEEGQTKVFEAGRSKTPWPDSNHNPLPSRAFDFAPYPIDWGTSGTSKERAKAIARFYFLGGMFVAVAEILKAQGKITHSVRWGGDWDGDGEFTDQSFDDLGHVELTR